MSFYTSLSGLRNAQTDLGVIAHNIANAETTGFKKSKAQFSDLVAGGANAAPHQVRGIGATVAGVTQDFGLGAIEQTGTATDFSINGDGFFSTVHGESGRQLYTRDGSFGIDENGFLQDGDNNRMQVFELDANGDPANPGTTIDAQVPPVNAAGASLAGVTIESDGRMNAAYTDGSIVTVGRAALATFLAPSGLRQTGSASWEATGSSGAPELGLPGNGQYGTILSGALERSNVDLAEEMVGLISAQRNFQANAKAIDTASQLSQTIINLRT
ncbi:MAG: flagellar hook basal-body protein [Pontixanthobacter sp.]